MSESPRRDSEPGHDSEIAAAAAFRERHGLPGLVDIHTHFMPDRVLRKVWAYFDNVEHRSHLSVPAWPIHYRGSQAERLTTLRAMGVRRFTSLLYPHRPGMAAWLNDWATAFAAATPDCAHTATFWAEPEAPAYIEKALADGARVIKAHVQVGGYDPADPLLDGVWGQLEASGTPVVIHCGSGPEPGPHTGPGPIRTVLARHPDLTLVIAHLGMPEYAEFLSLTGKYAHVHLDTTMVFTDFTETIHPFPRTLLPHLAEVPDRIVLGTDFPNIPYPFSHQLEALEGLGLGNDWLRAVCWDNGMRLLGR